jgi:tetratricopeptide (TPR) repeat protein
MALLMFQSHSYAKMFGNQKTLWTYALQHNEAAWPAQDNIGNVLFTEGYEAKAEGHMAEAEALTAEAVEHYQISLRINPHRMEAYNNLGLALDFQGKNDDALQQYKKALEINPSFILAHLNLAGTLTKAGRIPEAIDQYEQVLKIDPDNNAARDRLAKLQGTSKAGP